MLVIVVVSGSVFRSSPLHTSRRWAQGSRNILKDSIKLSETF